MLQTSQHEPQRYQFDQPNGNLLGADQKNPDQQLDSADF